MKSDWIILGFASLWSLYWTIRNQHLFGILITLVMIAGIILGYLRPNDSVVIGLTVFYSAALAALIYSFFFKKVTFAKSIVIALIILPPFFYWIFLLNHLTGAEWLWYGLFIPFIALIYGIMHPVDLKNEWGFIILLLADAVCHIYPILLN